MGQPVVPENRVGAGGSIGSKVVVDSAPDGYTLLANSSAHVANPGIYAKLPYDTLKDFTNLCAPRRRAERADHGTGFGPEDAQGLRRRGQGESRQAQFLLRRHRQRHALPTWRS